MSLRFPTKHAAPAYEPPKKAEAAYSGFQFAIRTLPEKHVVKLSASAVVFGAFGEDVDELVEALEPVYDDIAADPRFRGVGSALPYCYSRERPDQGHYFLSLPEKLDADTRLLIFQHGWGGNFLFYVKRMADEFPDDIIAFPSLSYSGSFVNRGYIRDMKADLERRMRRRLPEPWLLGISAGSIGGYELYTKHPDDFVGFIGLASSCPRTAAQRVRPAMRIHMVVGDKEQHIPKARVEKQAAWLRPRLADFSCTFIEGDHFFLATNPDDTAEALRAILDRDARR